MAVTTYQAQMTVDATQSSAQSALSISTTPACVGLLYDAKSNRTFRIPDVPTTSSVAHIKHWYGNNVDNCDPRTLSVFHNSQLAQDTTQVWQLAQGQGQFAVTVTHAQSSPRAVLSIYVDHALNAGMPPINLHINSDSTVLFAKQKLFEMLDLPMGLASAADTTLVLLPVSASLKNEATLGECNVLNNARLSLALSTQREAPGGTPPALPQPPIAAPQPATQFQPQPPPAAAPPGFTTPPHYQRIKEIWGSSGPPEILVASEPIMSPPVLQKTTHPSTALLPANIFDEDDEEVGALAEYMGSIPFNPAAMMQHSVSHAFVPAFNQNQNNLNPHNDGATPQQRQFPADQTYPASYTTPGTPGAPDFGGGPTASFSEIVVRERREGLPPRPQPHQQQQQGQISPTPSRRSRGGRRSRSPPGSHPELTQDQLNDLAQNFRTRSCRNGPSCKFGRNCWFAHNNEELRRPTDPLPNNLPAVHKLERYSHREAAKVEPRPRSL